MGTEDQIPQTDPSLDTSVVSTSPRREFNAQAAQARRNELQGLLQRLDELRSRDADIRRQKAEMTSANSDLKNTLINDSGIDRVKIETFYTQHHDFILPDSIEEVLIEADGTKRDLRTYLVFTDDGIYGIQFHNELSKEQTNKEGEFQQYIEEQAYDNAFPVKRQVLSSHELVDITDVDFVMKVYEENIVGKRIRDTNKGIREYEKKEYPDTQQLGAKTVLARGVAARISDLKAQK